MRKLIKLLDRVTFYVCYAMAMVTFIEAGGSLVLLTIYISVLITSVLYVSDFICNFIDKMLTRKNSASRFPLEDKSNNSL